MHPPTSSADAILFTNDPWLLAPIHNDYGSNVQLGAGVLLNSNITFIDTCPITIEARTLVGPNCKFCSSTHLLDPTLRNGIEGPGFMQGDPNRGRLLVWRKRNCPSRDNDWERVVDWCGECYYKGNLAQLWETQETMSLTVYLQEIPPFRLAAGNPARILRKIATAMDPEQTDAKEGEAVAKEGAEGAEVPMANASR